ncbi:MAG: hypothetical protein QXX64_03270 [Nitrososphaera sp.]
MGASHIWERRGFKLNPYLSCSCDCGVNNFGIGSKVFGEVGVVHDIGMLYTRLTLENGDEMLASNTSMVTSTVILKKRTEQSETAQKDVAA